MAFATDLYCNITFNRKTFNSKYEVEDRIEELNGYIYQNEEKLKMLALLTEPDKLLNKDEDESYFNSITIQVEEALESLQDYYIEKYKLELLLDNWNNCHTKKGLAIYPPKNVIHKTYLCGDFISSTKYPNKDIKL